MKESIALGFLNIENVRSTGCVPEDFADGNLNKILSVIWQMILKYQIQILPLTYGMFTNSFLFIYLLFIFNTCRYA